MAPREGGHHSAGMGPEQSGGGLRSEREMEGAREEREESGRNLNSKQEGSRMGRVIWHSAKQGAFEAWLSLA